MMKLKAGLKYLWLSGMLITMAAQASPPAVTNIRATQRPGSQLVDIFYNLADPEQDRISITLLVSSDGGISYSVPVLNTSGAIGANVPTGQDLQIVWNAGADWPGKFSDKCKVRIIADDNSSNPAPQNMALIPAGLFQMGDNLDNDQGAQPPHEVYVSAFFMDKFEVSGGLWKEVVDWASSRGYDPFSNGQSVADGHPVHSMTWYDAVRWCNARSEMEGLNPVYYTTAAQTTIYKKGDVNLSKSMVKWSANGYRLPTEAEWEKAARGGLRGKRYPWGDTITGSQANYSGSGDAFEGRDPATTPVGYYRGQQKPAGGDMANGYGLYDMAGNIWEWVWDSPEDYWNRIGGTNPTSNPQGSNDVSSRGLRGGSWNLTTEYLRCACRNYIPPSDRFTIALGSGVRGGSDSGSLHFYCLCRCARSAGKIFLEKTRCQKKIHPKPPVWRAPETM